MKVCVRSFYLCVIDVQALVLRLQHLRFFDAHGHLHFNRRIFG